MGLARQDGHRECRALAFPALDANRSAMRTREFLHQRETDARPLVRAGPGTLDPVKSIEEMRQFVCGDTDAGIRDRELEAIDARSERHPNPAFKGVFERVRQEIEDD